MNQPLILSPEVRDADLPLPNVYFVTVDSATHGRHHVYVAADFSGSAVAKVQRHCAENLRFRPSRGNSDIKLRRFKLGDYLECPEGLQAAYELAASMHERSTVEALNKRRHEVGQILEQIAQVGATDFAAVERALAEELRQIA